MKINWYDRAYTYLESLGLSEQDAANVIMFYTQTNIQDPAKWWWFIAEHSPRAIRDRIEEFGGNNAAALAPFKELPR